MIFHVLVELGLAAATLFLGNIWWQIRKRGLFLKQTISDQPCLDAFVSREALLNPPSRIEPYLQKNSVGYFVNMGAALKGDSSSQRLTKATCSICLCLILGVSFYLGYAYFGVNLGIFSLLVFSPLADATKWNALEQILILAVILHRWHEMNPEECENWVTQANSLQKLYVAVLNVG